MSLFSTHRKDGVKSSESQQRRLCHLTRESKHAVLVEVIVLIKATGNPTLEQFCVG